MQQQSHSNSAIENTEYLTRYEVANFFKCNVSTIHHWTQKKILKRYQIGGRVYYKRSEVESALTQKK